MMKATRSSLLLAACLGMMLLAPRPARAQSNAALAEALFEQARKEMAEGSFESACKKFSESDRLDPAIGTKFNLADCQEKSGHVASAWELFKAVESQLAQNDDRYPIARQRREALEPQLPKVQIMLAEGAPQGTVVTVGGVQLSAASLGIPLPMDPGKHELVVSAPGHGSRTFTVELERGRITKAIVSPGAAQAQPQAPAPEPTPAAVPATPATTAPPPQDVGAEPAEDNRMLGYVIGGVGVVGLGAGAITGFMAMGKKNTADDHCNDDLQVCDEIGKDANDAGRTLGMVSTIGFAVGLVGVGVGTYFIVTSGDGGAAETALMTQAGPNGGRLSLVGRW